MLDVVLPGQFLKRDQSLNKITASNRILFLMPVFRYPKLGLAFLSFTTVGYCHSNTWPSNLTDHPEPRSIPQLGISFSII